LIKLIDWRLSSSLSRTSIPQVRPCWRREFPCDGLSMASREYGREVVSGMIRSATNWPKAGEASLEVHLLGLVDFDACLFLQERLVEELSQRDDGHGAVLVCEHPPLITIGREGSQAHILCEPQELVARQLEVRWLNRGGGCLVHVPGQ